MSEGGKKRSGGWNNGGGGGGGGGGKKGKFWKPNRSNDEIPKGVRGFLVTCPGGAEGKCTREVVNLLTEFYEDMYGEKKPEAAAGGAGNVDALLAEELKELKDKGNALFVRRDSGVKAQVFISMNLEKEGGVVPLALAIIRKVAETRESKSRNVFRLLPVENTCYGTMEELKKMAEPILAENFPSDASQVVKYAIQFEHRAHNTLKRDDVIKEIAELVPKHHKVDLGSPDKTILIQCVKNIAAVAVVDDYVKYAKFNLQTLCMSDEDLAARKKQDGSLNAQKKTEGGGVEGAAAAAGGGGEEKKEAEADGAGGEKKE